MVRLDFEAAYDLTPNALAPVAAWVGPLQARGYFAELGRGPDGFDCLGLIEFVSREFLGRPAPNYQQLYREAVYGARDDIDRLIRSESEAWVNVEAGEVGDVVVCGHRGLAHHVMLLCGGGYALHALATAGLVASPQVGRRRVTHIQGMRLGGVVRPR